ncbi:MAG TPA: hypothetical protein VF188_04585 [Longimicrobiales bacterium]
MIRPFRGRIARDPDLQAFTEAKLREAWDGRRFPRGTILRVHQEALDRFGPDRAGPRWRLQSYAQHVKAQLEYEQFHERRIAPMERNLELLRRTGQQMKEVEAELEAQQASGELAERDAAIEEFLARARK